MNAVFSFIRLRSIPLFIAFGLSFGHLEGQESSVPDRKTETRLTAEQSFLFTNASDPYYFGGEWVDPAETRVESLAFFLQHADPRCEKISSAVIDLMKLNELADEKPAEAEKVMRDLTGSWQKFLGNSLVEGLGGPEVGLVESAENMILPVQRLAIREREMELFGSELRSIVRENVAEISSEGDADRRNAKGVITVTLKRIDDMVFMRVLNRTSKPFHNCVISARRVQGTSRQTNIDNDRALAAGLMLFLGSSAEAIQTNDRQAMLLKKVQQTEHGAFVFVPFLPAGEAVSFGVAPSNHFEFTEKVEANLWCDEGQEMNREVDLPEFFRATYEEQQRQARQSGSSTSPSPLSRPKPSGSIPGSATSLNGASGLNGSGGR